MNYEGINEILIYKPNKAVNYSLIIVNPDKIVPLSDK
jgi:hypothetical protein